MIRRTVALAGASAVALTGRALHRAAASPDEAAAPLSGDDLVPDATVSMDRAADFGVPPETLWPWIAQLGRGRAGWYFPRWLDALTPRSRRALRHVDPALTTIRVGDDHADWGPGNPVLRVSGIEPGRTVVYHSLRDPAHDHGWPPDGDGPGVFAMSWQLVLTPIDGASGSGCRLHLRVRARTRHRVLATLGDLFDGLTVVLLFAGLRERLTAPRLTPPRRGDPTGPGG